MSELLLCMSQEDVQRPYKFKMTNIAVYSFEEATYHCYHYWKQSVDDFTSEEFIVWVREELGLSFLASKIKEISRVINYSDKLIGFLSLFDYFDHIQLAKLKTELIEWERRLEWERLKERGDYLMEKAEPAKACVLYQNALMFEENKEILNNLGVAQMQLEHYPEAIRNFERAIDLGGENLQQILNLAEAQIYNGDFEKALKLLKRAEMINKYNPDIQYLYGELNMQTGNIRYSIDYFKRVLTMRYDEYYIYRLADVYKQLRQYDNALETINKIQEKNTKFLIKQAEIYTKADNIPAAVKAMERALQQEPDNIELWIKLAMYHRMNYDLVRAESAIVKALSLNKDNDMAQLESARIKKALGKTKDYQVVLHNILNGFKRKYRDLLNIEF